MRHRWRFVWPILWLALSVDGRADVASPDSLPVPVNQFPLAGRVYVIDPGHGGNDTGTKHEWPPGQSGKKRTYLYEKQFTLGLAIELRRQILAHGGVVVSTVVVPPGLTYLTFGQNKVPAQGADYINLPGQPLIESELPGFGRRLDVGRAVMQALPEDRIYWISLHFDFVRGGYRRDPTSGTRIIHAAAAQETTFVQVTHLVRKKVRTKGKYVIRQSVVTVDSILTIRPSLLVESLAQAFADSSWLRPADHRPVVTSGGKGIRNLLVLRGPDNPKIVKRQKYYNPMSNPVLIEYANFKSNADWLRLQQPEGSFKRLAEITVQGLIKHAQQDTTKQ